MFKKSSYLVLLVLVFSVFLAACGDTTVSSDELPKYDGAKNLTMSDSTKKRLNVDAIAKNGGKLEAFSMPDQTTKIKSFYTDELAKKGWSEDKNLLDADEMKSLSQFESVGGFALTFTKGDQAILCIGLPGSLGGPLGFSELEQKDTLVLVGSGSKQAIRAK